MTMVNGPTSIKTTFKMSDPKRMEISLASLGTAVLQIAVEKDTLTLTDEKGKALKYKKAKQPEPKQPEAKQPEAKQPAPQKQSHP
jgi:hypothetical protein